MTLRVARIRAFWIAISVIIVLISIAGYFNKRIKEERNRAVYDEVARLSINVEPFAGHILNLKTRQIVTKVNSKTVKAVQMTASHRIDFINMTVSRGGILYFITDFSESKIMGNPMFVMKVNDQVVKQVSFDKDMNEIIYFMANGMTIIYSGTTKEVGYHLLTKNYRPIISVQY
jgi:hypothetical protein